MTVYPLMPRDDSAPPVYGSEVRGFWGGVRTRANGTTVTHWAYDLMGPIGTPIWNMADGQVVKVETSEHGGRQVVIRYDDPIQGKTAYARHSHCDRVFVREGDRVRRGQRIALLGNTGVNANGRRISPHLHWQVMDKIAGGEPIDMPAMLAEWGIELRRLDNGKRTFVWKADAVRWARRTVNGGGGAGGAAGCLLPVLGIVSAIAAAIAWLC